MGKLSGKWVESMVLAVRKAKAVGKLVVFGPVGAYASSYRKQVAERLWPLTSGYHQGQWLGNTHIIERCTDLNGVDITTCSASAVETAIKLFN